MAPLAATRDGQALRGPAVPGDRAALLLVERFGPAADPVTVRTAHSLTLERFGTVTALEAERGPTPASLAAYRPSRAVGPRR